ncbi:MAG: NAD(+)/NADH kinase [Candidatus Xiphinematobacter sp.]|nr:MAG: NAD(+)/NADH kinase [Candidatus Xiphinematobacter sp.]QQY08121.1 MAG: NAD(+)/NADH kinase [Candidatus Xiphinematobacter sp.]QQY11084.1 MAG: NAD(+)/NADH kinase [Candidatus Xiphinematobacter sp.]
MIGLIAHISKPEAKSFSLIQRFVENLRGVGIKLLLEESAATVMGEKSHSSTEKISRCELVVVFGGDGTILRAVHRMTPHFPPIFGINTGSLGFLTCLGPQEIGRAIECIICRSFVLSYRSMLSLEIESKIVSRPTFNGIGLNDIVISRGSRSQLVRLTVLINNNVLTNYYADGLIIATPTGSTAYSLAAGGPILMPESGVFVITPICPHVLTNRSTVVSDHSVIEVRLLIPEQEINVTIDGQTTHRMSPGETLRLSKAHTALPLAMLPERDFSQILSQKLKWSGSNL